jgi:predicted nucleotidyltransferase
MERKALGSQMEIDDFKKDLFTVFDKYKQSLVFAYLFGSATQKDGYPPSDVDIAVFVRSEGSQSHFELKLSLHADISRALKNKRIDLVILNSTTNLLLLEEIVRKGILL